MNIIYRMFVHDLLYVMADQLIKKYNPCQIHTSRSGLVTCLSDAETCCGGCSHISNNGCTVTCLGCKLGLCSTARELSPKLSDELSKMWRAGCSGLRHIRTSRLGTYGYLKWCRDTGKRPS